MTAAALLERLEGVRERRSREWSACCPAHNDRSPSLSIRECGDGTVLIKCFAGCSAADIVSSVGLKLRDLYPEPLPRDAYGRNRRIKRPRLDGWLVVKGIERDATRLVAAVEPVRHYLTDDEREVFDSALSNIAAVFKEARSVR